MKNGKLHAHTARSRTDPLPKFVVRTDYGARTPPEETGQSLGALAEEKVALVAVCKRCKHRRVLNTGRLAEALGAHVRVLELRPRLRCTQCGGRGPNLHEMTR